MQTPRMYREQLRWWLKEGLDQPGKTQTALAELLGRQQPDISKMISGKRRIQVHEIPIIESYIGIPAPNSKNNGIEIVSLSKVAVRYEIEHGAFRRGDPRLAVERDHIPVVQQDAAQYGVVVKDSSAIDEVPPGAYAICIPIEQLDRGPSEGDLLHVHKRDSEGKIEHTLRILKLYRGKKRLNMPCPNPDEALDPDSPTVKIVGIVTGIYIPRAV